MLFRLATLISILALVVIGPSFVSAQTAAVPPAAPTNLRLLGGVLTWTDNASDEEGFRLIASASGAPIARLTLGRDVTSSVLPPEALASCPGRDAVQYELRAFRGSATSEAARTLINVECGSASTALPTAPPPSPAALPRTGSNGDAYPTTRSLIPLGALLAGIMLAALGIICQSKRRINTARDRRQARYSTEK